MCIGLVCRYGLTRPGHITHVRQRVRSYQIGVRSARKGCGPCRRRIFHTRDLRFSTRDAESAAPAADDVRKAAPLAAGSPAYDRARPSGPESDFNLPSPTRHRPGTGLADELFRSRNVWSARHAGFFLTIDPFMHLISEPNPRIPHALQDSLWSANSSELVLNCARLGRLAQYAIQWATALQQGCQIGPPSFPTSPPARAIPPRDREGHCRRQQAFRRYPLLEVRC